MRNKKKLLFMLSGLTIILLLVVFYYCNNSNRKGNINTISKKAKIIQKTPIIKGIKKISELIPNQDFTGILTGPLQAADFIYDLPEGIKIGETFTNTLKEKLGTPLKIEDQYPEGTHERYYYYQGYNLMMLVGFRENKDEEVIASLNITEPGLKTNRGLTVGDDESCIPEKYGPKEPGKGKYAVYDYSFKEDTEAANDDRYIWFVVDNQKIKSIQIYGY